MGPRCRRLFSGTSLRVYLLCSKVHWTPRERAIRRALEVLADGGEVGRIVDVGCGPGLLAGMAEEMNLAYLGLDADADCVEFCRRTRGDFSNATFAVHDATRGAGPFNKKDILVLNGVAHHLDDSRLAEVIESAGACGGLIVADHLRRISGMGRIAVWMQRADRGGFVRPYERFERLAGFTIAHHEEFPIRVAGIALWTYFCNAYGPRRR